MLVGDEPHKPRSCAVTPVGTGVNFMHLARVQKLVVAQWAVTLHELRHVVPPGSQRNAPGQVCEAETHVPEPLQLEVVSVEPRQVGALQEVFGDL
jgi:hypothetical protein